MAKKYGGDKKRKRVDEEVNSENEKLKSSPQTKSESYDDSKSVKKVTPSKNTSSFDNDINKQQKIKPFDKLTNTNEEIIKIDKRQEEIPKISTVPAGPKKRGGLQTQNEITEELQRKEEKIEKELKNLQKLGADKHATIHRDSEGRKINPNKVKNTNSKTSELRAREEKKRKVEKFNKNEANIAKERQMRERLRKMKNERINIYENDKKHIDEQKETIKSEDPALVFDKHVIEKHKELIDKQFVSITGRKLYKDVTHYPMNRFNIKPGWRWDGILRGNGFEQKWHDAQLQKRK